MEFLPQPAGCTASSVTPIRKRNWSVVRNCRDKEINIHNWVVCALHYADCWVLFLCNDWPFRPITPTAKITRRTALPFSRNADSWMTSDFFTNLCCAVDRSPLWDNLVVFLFDFWLVRCRCLSLPMFGKNVEKVKAISFRCSFPSVTDWSDCTKCWHRHHVADSAQLFGHTHTWRLR